MAARKPRIVKAIVKDTLSVEGSRALEPLVDPLADTPEIEKTPAGRKTYVLGLLAVGLVMGVTVLAAYYGYQQFQLSQLSNSKTATQAQVKSLITEVGKVALLPTAETPTIATVSDKTKLSGQAFFTHAENGDKVLIYTKAKKAILYRPSTHMIIEIGPITIATDVNTGSQVAGASTSATPTPTVTRVALFNGTTVAGLTKKVEQSLKTTTSTARVVMKANASKSDYEKTVVVPLLPSQKTAAQKLATTLNGTVISLPEGEVAPNDADVLIILGQNAAK